MEPDELQLHILRSQPGEEHCVFHLVSFSGSNQASCKLLRHLFFTDTPSLFLYSILVRAYERIALRDSRAVPGLRSWPMRFAQLVVGPAGSGKVSCSDPQHQEEAAPVLPALPPPQVVSRLSSQHIFKPALALQSTYCETIKQHCDAINRPVHVVNLGEHSGFCKAKKGWHGSSVRHGGGVQCLRSRSPPL